MQKLIIGVTFINKVKSNEAVNFIIADKVSFGIEVKEEFSFSGSIIKDCTFNEDVEFINSNFHPGVKFINCKFLKNLSFNSCIAKDNNYHFTNGLIFENCTLGSVYFNGKNHFDKGILFNKTTIENKLIVAELVCSKGGFQIHENSTINILDIFDCTFNSIVDFNKSTINGEFRTQNLIADSFSINKSTFNKFLYLWHSELRSFIINDSKFLDTIDIQGVKISDTLSIATDTLFSKTFTIVINDADFKGNINKVFIDSTKFEGNFILSGYQNIIDSIDIKCSQKLTGNLKIIGLNISIFSLTGFNNNAIYYFDSCQFNKLNLIDFDNNVTLRFSSCKAFGLEPKINFRRANLGKTYFYNMDFNSFHKLFIEDSVLNELIIVSCKWFSTEKLNPHNHLINREVFRQIKYSLEKTNNRIDALMFNAYEMQAFEKELVKEKWYSINRFILIASKTNDFGQNWKKPVLILLGVTLLFYPFILVGLSLKLDYCSFNLDYCSIKTTISELLSNFHIAIQMLDPTHSLEKMKFEKDSEIEKLTYVFDYFYKGLLAFFLFQTVSAFRKFVK